MKQRNRSHLIKYDYGYDLLEAVIDRCFVRYEKGAIEVVGFEYEYIIYIYIYVALWNILAYIYVLYCVTKLVIHIWMYSNDNDNDMLIHWMIPY